jgi:hypothetical protein
MSIADYPDELKLATWEKKKGALPARHAIGETLKALLRKHEAIDWKKLAPAGAAAARSLDELDKFAAAVETAWGGPVAALKKQLLGAAGEAAELAAAKGAEKAQVDAGKAMATAAKALAKALDEAQDGLKSACSAARAALAKDKDKGKDDEDDALPAALVDPKKLLAQLQASQRNPALKLQFAFVDGNEKEKKPAVLAMHPRNSGKSMFAKLTEVTGVKAGAYGLAWIDGKTLVLQVEKTLGGLAKKARLPVKASGFRVSSIVLWSADGKVLEQDNADEEEGAETESQEAPRSGGPDLAAVWDKLRTELTPEIRKAIEAGGPQRADLAALASSAATLAKSGDLAGAIAAYAKAKKLLAGGGPSGSGASGPEFQAELKTLAPAIAALNADKSKNPEAARLAAEMMSATKAQDFAAAAALLAQLRPLLGKAPADDFPSRWKAAREAWQGASDLVDNQLGKLQAKLREETDAELKQIAEFGINAVTGGHKVPLMAAMRDIGSGESADPTVLAEAKQAADDFLAHLKSDARVAACDENPFGVSVTLRSTLGGALERLAAVLSR